MIHFLRDILHSLANYMSFCGAYLYHDSHELRSNAPRQNNLLQGLGCDHQEYDKASKTKKTVAWNYSKSQKPIALFEREK
jgi:hypothetical protein